MAKRADRNQPEIMQALRQVGAHVQTLHEIGKGCPDLLCMFRGEVYLLEVKDGNKPPSAQKLTPDECDWIARANHAGVVVHIVNSTEKALQIIGAI